MHLLWLMAMAIFTLPVLFGVVVGRARMEAGASAAGSYTGASSFRVRILNGVKSSSSSPSRT